MGLVEGGIIGDHIATLQECCVYTHVMTIYVAVIHLLSLYCSQVGG